MDSQTKTQTAAQWLLPPRKRMDATCAQQPQQGGSQGTGSGDTKGQTSQPSTRIELLPAPLGNDELQWHKKERQEAARACKRQRLAGDGRFPQEEVKAYLRSLQEKGEVQPEPTPEPQDPLKEAFEKLQAFESCLQCSRCTGTSKTKGCKSCLGQFCCKYRLTMPSLAWQRQLFHDLRKAQPHLH